MVPRSGCSRISAAGQPGDREHADHVGGADPAPPGALGALGDSSAIPITTASLANSEGWIDMPPSISQERDPLIVEPMTSTSTRPITDAR